MPMDIQAPELLRNRCFIDGQWIGDNAPQVEITDPATGESIGHVPNLGKEETQAAIAAASRAFPAWRARPVKERAALLRNWFDMMRAHQEDLAVILTREQGKPLAESRGEIAYSAAFLEFSAEEAKRVHGEIIPAPGADKRVVVSREPVGVAASITPWNFPSAMITRKLAPALAAGCTMVCKPAPQTPFSALALGVLAEKAGIPAGVVNFVTGDAGEIGAEMTSNPDVRLLTFTGSTAVGRKLMAQCAPTVKKLSLELGGNAPFIVFDDADIDKAVAGAMASKFRNSGQTCICANRILVDNKVADEFVGKLCRAVEALKVGNGMEEGVTQGPLINDAAVEKVERLVNDAVGKGASMATGGGRHSLGGTFYTPGVLENVTPEMDIMHEEIFGPVAAVVRFDEEAEAVALANDTPHGLAGYFYSRDIARCWRVAEALECGMVGINEGIISSETVPFGGVKQSGVGREGGKWGVEEYLEVKYMLMGGIGPQ